MELLIEILSPCSSISYGGCQFLRVARAEEDEPRQVCRIDDSSGDDDGRRDLNDALDNQALDLNVNYDDYRLLDSEWVGPNLTTESVLLKPASLLD